MWPMVGKPLAKHTGSISKPCTKFYIRKALGSLRHNLGKTHFALLYKLSVGQHHSLQALFYKNKNLRILPVAFALRKHNIRRLHNILFCMLSHSPYRNPGPCDKSPGMPYHTKLTLPVVLF